MHLGHHGRIGGRRESLLKLVELLDRFGRQGFQPGEGDLGFKAAGRATVATLPRGSDESMTQLAGIASRAGQKVARIDDAAADAARPTVKVDEIADASARTENQFGPRPERRVIRGPNRISGRGLKPLGQRLVPPTEMWCVSDEAVLGSGEAGNREADPDDAIRHVEFGAHAFNDGPRHVDNLLS